MLCHAVVCCGVLCAGVQQVVAVEYRQIQALNVAIPAGSKLLVVNPAVRRGMLLLQQEHVVLLGGMVSHTVSLCEQHCLVCVVVVVHSSMVANMGTTLSFMKLSATNTQNTWP
jgi:hypothetical protein